jgi:uncharacterized membrane protein
VLGVVDELDVYATSDEVPGLKGAPRKSFRRRLLLPENWDPTTRVLAGAVGAGLALAGSRRGGLIGLGGIAIGAGLAARTLTNLPIGRILGIGRERCAFDVEKTMTIAAPPNTLYALWTHPERFPQIMEHVRSVGLTGPDRTSWCVRGPGDLSIRWEAVTTRAIPNQLVAWKTREGSLVPHAGSARFEELPNGSTRMDIRMSYSPPLGLIGQIGAQLLGADPKRILNDDLVRLKSLIERGKTTVHHHVVDRSDLAA